MRKLDVLVVEDDPETRFLFADILRAAGHDVRETEHGQHALDVLVIENWRPDVIVLDVAMPVMDGIAFLARKRQGGDWSDIPVVIVSGTARPPIEGARCVLSKPVEVDDLLSAVMEHAG